MNRWGDVQSWLSVVKYTTPAYIGRTLELLDANAPRIAQELRKALEKEISKGARRDGERSSPVVERVEGSGELEGIPRAGGGIWPEPLDGAGVGEHEQED